MSITTVLANISKSKSILTSETDLDLLSSWETTLQRFVNQQTRIAVVGEIKKGKSTLINAFIGGPELTPTASDIATSTVYYLGYSSKEEFQVVHETDNPESKPLVTKITRNEIARYGTEDGNPNNQLRVDKIEIKCPSPFLSRGFEMVDTPGLGGLFRKHGVVTWSHLPKADAIMFVVDSVESVFTRDDADYLKKLLPLQKPIFFVQTKTDMTSEEQWKTWKQRNVEIIAKIMGRPPERIPYFAVSAKFWKLGAQRKSQGMIEKSGFKVLLSFVSKTIPGLASRPVIKRINKELYDLLKRKHADVKGQMELTQGNTKEKLKELEKTAKQTQIKFKKWRTSDFQQMNRDTQEYLLDLRRATTRQFQDNLDPRPEGEFLSAIESEIQALVNGNLDRLNPGLEQLMSDVQGSASEKAAKIMGDFQGQVKKRLRDIGVQFGRSFSSLTPSTTASSSANVELTEISSIGSILMAKGTGGLAVAMIGGPIGWAAGIGIGVWMYNQKKEEIATRRKREAERKVIAQLSKLISAFQKESLRSFEDLYIEVQRTIKDAQDSVVSMKEKDLEAQMDMINQMKEESRDQANTRIDNLKNESASVGQLIADVAQIGKGLK